MSKKNKTDQSQPQKNFLDYIPVQKIPWDTDDKGKVYLIKEKTKQKWLKKVIDWVGKNQNFHIHLDETGSFVWRAIDGKTTVHQIVLRLKEHFGENFKQPEQRVSFFLGMMKKNKFVDLLEAPKTQDPPAA